jgi:hypothetical protein
MMMMPPSAATTTSCYPTHVTQACTPCGPHMFDRAHTCALRTEPCTKAAINALTLLIARSPTGVPACHPQRHMDNINILKEQLHSAKMRAADADKAITEAHELRIHAERLQQELDQWHKLFPGTAGAASRPDPSAVAQMQQEALNSRQSLAQKEGEVKKLAQQVKELQGGADKLTREAADARSEVVNSSRMLAIAERRLGLLARERDSLKKIMDVVEQEPLAAGAGGEQQLAEALARLTQQRERCRMLEEKQQVRCCCCCWQ